MSDAIEMIKEVKSLISVQGFRGLPKADMKILAQAIVQISQLAGVREIKDAEINPVIIKEGQEGLVAVDGLITLNWLLFGRYVFSKKKYLHAKF